MTKTITLSFWAGGGVFGHSQLINAQHITDKSGIHIDNITEVHCAGSIGNIPAMATALKKPYQTAQENFRECANTMMSKELRSTQLKRSVIHSLRNISGCGRYNPKSIVLKDHTGSIHLEHGVLRKFLIQSFEDTKLSDLDSGFVSFAHHMEENDRICFAHIGKKNERSFDFDKWDIVPNHGGHHTLTDIAMASTAAPTVYAPHEIEGNHYIDCANVCSPLSVLKNLFRMASNPEDLRVEILFFGTGYATDKSWNPETYKNHGILEMIADWTRSTGYGNIKQDYREMIVDYGERVNFTLIDMPIHSEYDDKKFEYDTFNGSPEYMDSIEKIAHQNLLLNGDSYARTIERIAEQKERENAIDPLAAQFTCIANNNHTPPIQQTMPQPSTGQLIVNRLSEFAGKLSLTPRLTWRS